MKKVETKKIKLKDIKHVENARLRGVDDVSDLMHDIEQRGVMENVAVRTEDNALIFGNRRVKACEKLGYEEIEADFYVDVDDNELLFMNLAENLKRKSINSIEIGRACKILADKGMTHSEVSERLGITKCRVTSCISAFNITVGTPFEKLVTFNKIAGRGKKVGIPESLIWNMQNSLQRVFHRKITKKEWESLLRAAETGKLHSKNLSTLRYFLMYTEDKNIDKALELLDYTKIVYSYMTFNEKELLKAKRKEKIDSDVEFVKHIVKTYNKDLLF